MSRLRPTIVVVALLGLAGCTDVARERRSATRADRPADISCRSFGQPFYTGRSTGKVTYDEGGRVTFVDRANGRLTTIEGECMIVYARGGK